jgi:hypothetical protein
VRLGKRKVGELDMNRGFFLPSCPLLVEERENIEFEGEWWW